MPFSFVFNEALLLQGSILEVVFATLSAVLVLVVVVLAVEGHRAG